ncbi:MAG TPA: hypothetical protein VFH27_05090, partial [Longimicrobiaceae bacterium]|nr:hypothetical protein [Longimicrobiaceae bacterium]
PGSGELVVLVEQGWVAHRAGQDLHLPLDDAQRDTLSRAGEYSRQDFASQLGGRLYRNLLERSVWGESLDDRPGRQVAQMAAGDYVMKLAWPVYRLEACGAPRVRVVVMDTALAEPITEEAVSAEDLSSQVVRAFEAGRPAMFTRMVARGLAKYAISQDLERRARHKGGEVAGWFTGAVTNVAGNALERADTRSWSLLPDRIGVARFSLPAGRHRVRVETLAPDGSVAGTVDLGMVEVTGGATVFRSERVWGSDMGDMRRLARLGQRAGGVE